MMGWDDTFEAGYRMALLLLACRAAITRQDSPSKG